MINTFLYILPLRYANDMCEHFFQIPKDLVHAQFYYLDKFILNCVGNWLSLYKYALNEGTKDDVKR